MIIVRHIRLRSVSSSAVYGADLPLFVGLNVIQAANTSGKSTVALSILYGLGLERALGPKLDVPLPYAMRENIMRVPEGDAEPVLQSYVMLEIENSKGERLTIRRDVSGGSDRKLMQTWSSAIGKIENAEGRRDFFLHDAGSATRADGFHYFLAKFIGWDLPPVPRFDGAEGTLYLEALFPMFFVEQKRGWVTTQGPLPSFLGIQDLPRRVMEFILDLDAGKVRRRRGELRRELALVEARFSAARKDLAEYAGSFVRLEGLPQQATAEFAISGSIRVAIFYEDEWMGYEQVAKGVAARVATFEQVGMRAVDELEEQLRKQLVEAEARYEELRTRQTLLQQDYQLSVEERRGLDRRIETLKVDLKRNLDAQKLQALGSTLGVAISSQACPTCHQNVEQELLPTVRSKAMGLEENISFIRSQIELYAAMMGAASDDIAMLGAQLKSIGDEAQDMRSNIRSLKSDLLRPGASLARSELEEIVRLQSRLERWASLQELVDGAIDGLRAIAREAIDIKEQLSNAGSGNLTVGDQDKITLLERSIQNLLQLFGFSSFKASEISLSEDDFRPQVLSKDEEGREIRRDIGFEASASDGIRLKWAYYLSILALSLKRHTHHLGLVVFDEPGQQQMKEVDLASFLGWSAEHVGDARQVIVTTSEVRERVRGAVEGFRANLLEFDSFILQPIASG